MLAQVTAVLEGASDDPSPGAIFVATAAAEMRRGFDGLAAAAHEVLGEDPQSGALFLFLNRRRERLKRNHSPTPP